MARGPLLFHSGLLLASAPVVLTGVVLALATGSPAWLLSLLAVLPLQLAALPGIPGRRMSMVLLGVSYHALRLVMPRRARKSLSAECMVVEMNNRSLERSLRGFGRDASVLLLLPHCLQFHECTNRIVFDQTQCTRCGRCDIAGLLALADRFGLRVSIATGGTAARKAVEESRPDLVIAVACPRDLCSGILDSADVPVYGVLNSRPNGDCFDTKVDTGLIGSILQTISAGRGSKPPERPGPGAS